MPKCARAGQQAKGFLAGCSAPLRRGLRKPIPHDITHEVFFEWFLLRVSGVRLEYGCVFILIGGLIGEATNCKQRSHLENIPVLCFQPLNAKP